VSLQDVFSLEKRAKDAEDKQKMSKKATVSVE